LYAAPATVASAQTVTVTATSVADPTKWATGTVTLAPTPNPSDLASAGTASQSSLFAGSTGASKAIDGNTDGNFTNGSVSCTNPDLYAWWQVDLGASASITSITIWNRTDGSMARLGNYWVFVSDTPFSPSDTPASLPIRAGTWSSRQTSFPNPSINIPVNAQGRYARIQLSTADYLQIAEVQIFGTASAHH